MILRSILYVFPVCHQVAPISSFHSERELYLLKRAQEAEEKLTEANTLIEHLKTTSLQREKEMEAKILERKVQQDKELSQLSQENYVLQTQVPSYILFIFFIFSLINSITFGIFH